MEVNIFDNNFNKIQAGKILSIYGVSVDLQPIIKSEDPGDEQPEEDQDPSDLSNFKKSLSDSMPEMIEKGIISSTLANGYGNDEPIKFTKTGKELKEVLPTVIASLSGEQSGLEAQMLIIRQAVGIDPTIAYNSYNVKGIMLYRYPWSMCDAPYDSVSQNYGELTDQNKLCNQYNSLCSLCMDICEDIACCKVMLANLDDSKKYNLSVNQLVALSMN